MGHIFLTAPIQTGKSTAIRRFLSANRALSIGGFVTVSRPSAAPGAEWDVYILPPGFGDADLTPERLVGRRGGERQVFPEAFDMAGTALLERKGPFDLLLMDELGRMELRSPRFRSAVLTALDGDTPVLGVIKPEHNEFLDAVRAHPKVKVLELTAENRDKMSARIAYELNI